MSREDEIRAMSDNELRITVAELCGWNKPVSQTGTLACPDTEMCPPRSLLYQRLAEPIPNYPYDLNAMHEAEKLLTDYGRRALYINWVYGLICRDKNGRMFDEAGLTPTDNLIFAKARQRAEAFVLVMELQL